MSDKKGWPPGGLASALDPPNEEQIAWIIEFNRKLWGQDDGD